MRKQDDRCSSKEVSCLPYFRILFSESPICPYLKLQQLFAVIHLSPPCNRISEKVTFSALPMAGQSGYDSVSEKVILSFWDMSEKGMSF